MKKIGSALVLCGVISTIAVSLTGCGGGETPQAAVPVASIADLATSPAAKSGQPEILVTNYNAGIPTTAVVFAKGARANAVPLRSFRTKVPVFGIRSDGTYWSGPIYTASGPGVGGYVERHSANGKVMEKIAGSAYEPLKGASTNRNGDILVVGWQGYPSGYGCVILTGTIRLFSAASSYKQSRAIAGDGYCINAIYAGPNGDVYIGYDDSDFYGPSDDNALILEVGPQATNLSAPTREIQFEYPYDTIQSLTTDTHGNLFALEDGELLKYAPGKTTASHVLKGVAVRSFAIDSKNDLYVVVGSYIEEFAPGATHPMRVIGGPATGLINPAGIAVAD